MTPQRIFERLELLYIPNVRFSAALIAAEAVIEIANFTD